MSFGRIPLVLRALGLHAGRVHSHGYSQYHDEFVRFRMLHAGAHSRPDELRHLHRRQALHQSGEQRATARSVYVRLRAA